MTRRRGSRSSDSGKERAEIGQAGGPEERVGDRVGDRVGVGVADETPAVERHAREHERCIGASGEGMHVVTEADADAHGTCSTRRQSPDRRGR